jgi:hypothetical protein
VDGVVHQRRLVDLLVTGLPLLILILGVFVISLVSLALPLPRQRAALKIIGHLAALVTALSNRPVVTPAPTAAPANQ